MRGDNWPYQCQAHPRPDQALPADDVRTDAAWIAWAVCVFLAIVFLSSWIPA